MNKMQFQLVTSTSGSTPGKKRFELVSNSDGARRTNWESHHFGELFSAISRLSDLETCHDFHLDPAVGRRVTNLLGFLFEQTNVAPPRLVNHDGETLALTWNLGKLKTYLAVTDESADIMTVDLRSGIRCEEEIEEDGSLDLGKLLENLPVNLVSRTTT